MTAAGTLVTRNALHVEGWGENAGEVSPWAICLECDCSEREWQEGVTAASRVLVRPASSAKRPTGLTCREAWEVERTSAGTEPSSQQVFNRGSSLGD